MDAVIIREMLKEEIEWSAGVIRKGFGTVAREFGLTVENCPANGAFIKADRLREDLDKGNHMYVLLRNRSIIGFFQLEQKPEDRIELEKLTVLVEFRHYGYGKMLLEYAKQKAGELGARQLTIGIIEENKLLKDWYAANGFLHTGTHKFEHLPFTVGYMSIPLNREAVHEPAAD